MLYNVRKAVFYLALTSAFVGSNAYATNICLTPNAHDLMPGDTLTLFIEGTDFPAFPKKGVAGGGFKLTWDSSVIEYTGIKIPDSPWDSSSITDTNVGSGVLDEVFLTDSDIRGAGPDFDIAEVTFNVIGNKGDNTKIAISQISGGWTDVDANILEVFHKNADVQVVPIPAAAWLLMSGVVGLASVARKGKMART